MSNIITKEVGGTGSFNEAVSYKKMLKFANKSDMILMYIGWVCALTAGVGMPSFVFLIGSIIDSFNSNTTS